MSDYIVKLLDATEKTFLSKGDLIKYIYDGAYYFIIDISKDPIIKTQPFIIAPSLKATGGYCASKDELIKQKYYLCTEKNIQQGDEVVIAYTDGIKASGFYKRGILTRKWDENEGPYCAINEKEIDLASEGHSSIVYKIICLIEGNDWLADGVELTSEQVKIESFFERKASKDLKEGDEVITDNPSGSYEEIGIIKKIEYVYKDAWDWEDLFILTNCKNIYYTEEKEENIPDFGVRRKHVVSQARIKSICSIQCPTCKHFH